MLGNRKYEFLKSSLKSHPFWESPVNAQVLLGKGKKRLEIRDRLNTYPSLLPCVINVK